MHPRLAIEVPIRVLTNGEPSASFLCTPEDLNELAIGHLLTRGFISSLDEVSSVKVELDAGIVHVTTKKALGSALYSVPEFVICGNSTVDHFSEHISRLSPLPISCFTTIENLQALANHMVEESPIHRKTGGVHGAIIQGDDQIFLREDIGRHCAVDKVVGAASLAGISFETAVLCTTGRISLDMLLKASAVGIPIIATLKSASSMAYALAQQYNVTIVGQILSPQPFVYTTSQRIS